jgi:chromate reductase, NAD(P)H dehydrogenase (quinone)
VSGGSPRTKIQSPSIQEIRRKCPNELDTVVLTGSLRNGSFTRALASAMVPLLPTLKLEIVRLGDLPLYNQDEEVSPPESWTRFRARIRRADAILFVTPEYNRSIPGALKNAVDVGSRPQGKNVWRGKPAAVVSATPGSLGAFGANHHLRRCLVAVDMPTLAQPEMYIAHVDKMLTASGALADSASAAFLRQFLESFKSWIRRVRG